jgi:outer membrane protein assembly factor BamB/tetratricopeptide (TPR) repeat protein
MSLKGNLSSVNLTEIFQMLSLSGREGTLFIQEGARKRAICFTKEGVSIRSRERNEGNLLGKVLIRLGRLEEAQLERALESRRSQNKLLGEALVETRACTQEDVDLAFRIQAEEDIQDLFLNRTDATFEYVDGYFPEDDGTPYVHLNVNSLLIEIARRTDEWEYIRRRVRSPRDIYRFTGAEGQVDAEVLADCYASRIDPFIDGSHSVADVIDRSFVNKFEVCKLLCAYLDAGVIELVPPEAVRQSARTALRSGDSAAAIRHYDYLMSTGDFPLEVMAEAAEAHEANRDFTEAAALLRRLAEEQARQGDARGAIDNLRRVANYPRPEPEALRYLLETSFQNPRAAEEFSSHIIEAGKTLVAHHLQAEQRSDALALLEKLSRAFPDELSFAISIVNVHFEDGNPGRAVQECERLAQGFLKRRRPSPAVSLYKKLLIIDPEREDVRDRIRKIATGKKSRSGAPVVARLAIALAVSCLLAGAAVVVLKKEVLKGVTGSSGHGRELLDEMMARAHTDLGLAEEHATSAQREYESARKELAAGDVMAVREAILSRRRVADQRYDQFRERHDAARSILDKATKQSTDLETSARARAMLASLKQLEEKVEGARRDWETESQKMAVFLREKGVTLYKDEGQLLAARDLFLLAQQLATDVRWKTNAGMDQHVRNISGVIAEVAEKSKRAKLREEEKDWTEARRIYLDLLRTYGRCDLVAQIQFPAEILTVPPGTSIQLDGVAQSQVTPAVVRLPILQSTQIRLSKRGFDDVTLALGPFGEGTRPENYSTVMNLRKSATWEYNQGAPVEALPAAWSGRVASAGRNGKFVVLDASNRAVVGEGAIDTLDGIAAGLACDGKHLFVPTIDGTLHVFDAVTSKPIARIGGFKGGLYVTPAVAGDWLYVVERSGRVSAYSCKSISRGKEPKAVWTLQTPSGVRAAPVVHDDHLIVVSSGGEVTVLNRLKGEEASRFQVPGTVSASPAVAGPGELVFGNEEGMILGLSKLTGEIHWRHEIQTPIRSTPVVRGRFVFVAMRPGELIALDKATGDEVPLGLGGAAATRSPVAGKDRIFFVSGSALAAYAPRADGYGLAWVFEAKGRILSGPLLEGGAVYLGDERGFLYRLEANDPE